MTSRLPLPTRERFPTAAARITVVLFATIFTVSPMLAAEVIELPLSGPAYGLADQAYAAYGRADYAESARLAQEALRLRPDASQLRRLLSDALAAAQRQTRQARVAPEHAAPAPRQTVRREGPHTAARSAPTPVPNLGPADIQVGMEDIPLRLTMAIGPASMRAMALHVRTPAQKSASPAVASVTAVSVVTGMEAEPSPRPAAPPAPMAPVDRAYQEIRLGHPREAALAFAEADRQGKLEPRQLQDAAFASVDAGDAPAAARYFRRALDAADTQFITLEPQQRQDIRVAVADQERNWGASVAAFYLGGGTVPGLTSQDQSLSERSLQATTELYWRPAALKGFAGGGTFVDFYGRLLGTLYSGAGYAQGGSSAQGALGLRAKPLGGVNLIAAAERLVKVGSASRDDWLLRLGYSNTFNTAPRADRGPWWSGDLYAETGRYLEGGEKYLVSEARFGRSWRIDPADRWPGVSSMVLTPHVVLAADYNTGFGQPRAIGAGAGINLRTWLHEDARSGPRSYSDLSLQYRHRLSGDDRAGGVVLRLSYNH